jgi:hypothetical protein
VRKLSKGREGKAAEIQTATCATLGLLFAQVLTLDEMVRKLSGATRSETAAYSNLARDECVASMKYDNTRSTR